MDHAAALVEQQINYVDVGTSGGVFGLERGYCLMVGGPDDAVEQLASVFDTLAPGIATAPRTEGRTGPERHRGARLAALRARAAPGTS